MKHTTSLNLTFVYHSPFWEVNGEIWTSYSPIGRYVESLADHFAKVTVVTPQRLESDQPLYRLKSPNLSLMTVKSHQNVQSYYLHLLHFYSTFFRSANDWDVLHVRMPTFTGFPAFLTAKIFRKPVFLVVVGENFGFNTQLDYSKIKKMFAKCILKFQDLLMKIMIRHSITFINGSELFKKYRRFNKHIYLMRSSTISETDILSYFRDTCIEAPYKILTVGTISPRKGTSLIPLIIHNLLSKGFNITWEYIGPIEGNFGEQEYHQTIKLADELCVNSRISFHNAIGFRDLLPYYRSSDIFVLPTYKEGVPRVILEAQASGLPVITTSVGGIPQAIKNGFDGLLTAPGDVDAIAISVGKVIFNHDLRKNLIKNGLETAKRFTLESETSQMLKKVNEILKLTFEIELI